MAPDLQDAVTVAILARELAGAEAGSVELEGRQLIGASPRTVGGEVSDTDLTDTDAEYKPGESL